MKIKGVVGGILLLCAGIFKFLQYQDENSGPNLGMLLDPLFNFLFLACAAIGIALIALAILQYFYERESGD
jgi:hypothetical protein